MAIPHAASAQVVDIRPLGKKIKEAVTTTLVKTDRLEVIRLVLPSGKEIPQHRVEGEITVQCLEGMVGFSVEGQTQVLEAGQLMYLAGGEFHGLNAIENSSVLVTILLDHARSE